MRQDIFEKVQSAHEKRIKALIDKYKHMDNSALAIERAGVVLELQQTEVKIQELGIKKGALRKPEHNIPQEDVDKRNALVHTKRLLQNKLGAIGILIKERNKVDGNFREELHALLIEVFGQSFASVLYRETSNRLHGGTPEKITPPMKEVIQSGDYVKKYRQLVDVVYEAKKTLQAWVNENEPEINKAEYYAKVKPLSFCLPPLNDIERMKRG